MSIRLAVIGLGNRAGKYMEWVAGEPLRVLPVAFVEPDPARLEQCCRKWGVENGFKDMESFLESGVEVDAVMITSLDDTHYPYAIECMKRGWHVLLEKPMATDPAHCKEIARVAGSNKSIVSLCYVLRFHPYYQKLKEIVSSGKLGRLLEIDHRIDVGRDRMTHTFVRGLWSSSEKSCPLVLSKTSHDVDFLIWLADDKVVSVTSSGSLSFYKSDMTPAGAASRCLVCPIEESCPFSAVDLYRRRDEWNLGFHAVPGQSRREAVEKELESGRYGRCVFHCDNDVVDNQRVDMLTGKGTKIRLVIDGIASEEWRMTSLVFEHGRILADGRTIQIRDSRNGNTEIIDLSSLEGKPFHAGADFAIVSNFVESIEGKGNLNGTGAEDALHSHLVCFAAEKARVTGKTCNIE